jgi:hypothetical protein
MRVQTDIDIDFADRSKVLSGLKHVAASRESKRGLERHNTGVYFQPIPRDPFENTATIEFNAAQELGYFKVDFLNVGIYEDVRDEEHLLSLMKEPDWSLLEIEEIVKELFHIGEYFWLVDKLKPKSVEQLAMLLAVMRPSKKHLANKSWDKIEKEVWIAPTDGEYHFKRSHATSYSMAIVVQLNLLAEKAAHGTM